MKSDGVVSRPSTCVSATLDSQSISLFLDRERARPALRLLLQASACSMRLVLFPYVSADMRDLKFFDFLRAVPACPESMSLLTRSTASKNSQHFACRDGFQRAYDRGKIRFIARSKEKVHMVLVCPDFQNLITVPARTLGEKNPHHPRDAFCQALSAILGREPYVVEHRHLIPHAEAWGSCATSTCSMQRRWRRRRFTPVLLRTPDYGLQPPPRSPAVPPARFAILESSGTHRRRTRRSALQP